MTLAVRHDIPRRVQPPCVQYDRYGAGLQTDAKGEGASLDFEVQKRDPLAQIVVQFPRDSLALLFLADDQAARRNSVTPVRAPAGPG